MNIAVPSLKPLDSTPPSVLYFGSSASYISGIMDVDIQECFGTLLQKYGDAVLKEEPVKDPVREAKVPKLKGGKGTGRPHNAASQATQPRRGRQQRGSPPAHRW